MEVTVNHLGSVQFEIKSREHTVMSDQPEENGGFNEGMTPPELLLASLGSCAAYYVVEYLKARNLAMTGTKVTVTAEKAKNPARLENFLIQVDVPVQLTDEQKQAVIRAADKCLVRNTLLHPPQIKTKVSTVEPVPA